MEGPIASVIAEGAYDGDFVYQAASLRQHDPPPDIVIPPRATSTAATNDDVTHVGVLTARDGHVRDIAQKGRMAWQKKTGYGRRSLVETAIGRYKQTIAPKLRARSCDGQQGEAAIAIQILNRMIRIAKPVSVRAP